MQQTVFLLYHEEDPLPRELAIDCALEEAGYLVTHYYHSTPIGSSYVQNADGTLRLDGPVVACASLMTAGADNIRAIVRSVRAAESSGRPRVFVIKLHRNASFGDSIEPDRVIANCAGDNLV